MKKNTIFAIDQFVTRYPQMAFLREKLERVIVEMTNRVKAGGKILVAGNGGSAADCEHIVGEFLKEFYIKRPVPADQREAFVAAYGEEGKYLADNLQGAIPAISFISHTGLMTAYANDAAPDLCNAQEAYGYCTDKDVFIGLSTSGNSNNIYYAILVAKMKGTYTVGLTGTTGGKMMAVCDETINVPEKETFAVQECHLPVYHLICRAVENEIFGE
ncbi:MAG: SIS domain-containing protein [Clostridia bacterium]|nr:SIS domain-containing protein [Clostridia bacterium]